jgi:hypothetical protein
MRDYDIERRGHQMTDQYAAIIEREFRRVLNNADASITVTFIPDDEAISVWVDGDTYTCTAGSDDDRFVFTSDTQTPVEFDFPTDWLALCE